MQVRPGLTGVVETTVTDDDTAIALGSGEVHVLATPRILALVEEATMRALDGELGEGMTSVGVRVQVEHICPTPVGASVRAEAHLDRVEGRRLTFKVAAKDDRGLVAAGKVTRVAVNIEQFMQKTR